jgi:hypothetical protein
MFSPFYSFFFATPFVSFFSFLFPFLFSFLSFLILSLKPLTDFCVGMINDTTDQWECFSSLTKQGQYVYGIILFPLFFLSFFPPLLISFTHLLSLLSLTDSLLSLIDSLLSLTYSLLSGSLVRLGKVALIAAPSSSVEQNRNGRTAGICIQRGGMGRGGVRGEEKNKRRGRIRGEEKNKRGEE